jgi:ribosomal protein S18 acetylase RimI-like enzyme
MHIGQAQQFSDELFEALRRLVPQLGVNKVPPTRDELIAQLDSDSSTLLVAREPNADGEISGVLTLTIYRVPTGVRSIIEDVIVDRLLRGHGIGEALMTRAIEIAREKGAAVVTLSANPTREAANRLYQRIGFERRETNAYIFRL